jgi:hypothetical protein
MVARHLRISKHTLYLGIDKHRHAKGPERNRKVIDEHLHPPMGHEADREAVQGLSTRDVHEAFTKRLPSDHDSGWR